MKSANPERNFALQQAFWNQFVSLSFDDLAATTFVTVRAQLEMRGTPIGAYDLQIAAIATHQEYALAHNLTLVTHNTREFERVEGLQIEDWEIEGAIASVWNSVKHTPL